MFWLCKKDLRINKDYPLASKNNETNQLLVGAAISTHNSDKAKADILVTEGKTDIIVVDSSQGNSLFQIDMVKYLKEKYPKLEVIGGNVVTKDTEINLLSVPPEELKNYVMENITDEVLQILTNSCVILAR